MAGNRTEFGDGGLSGITRLAGFRWRLERVKGALSRAMIGLAACAALWALLLNFWPSWIVPFPGLAVAAAVGLVATGAAAWLGRIAPEKVHRSIDRRLGLPDLALSAGELALREPGENGAAWIEHQRERALARIGSPDWREVWPVPWPKWSGTAAAVLAVLAALLGYLHAVHQATRGGGGGVSAHQVRRGAAFEELFKDWEQEQQRTTEEDREELKKLLEKVAPIRERLTNPQADERQIFSDLNRLEEIVSAEKAKLEAKSLEPYAGQIAEALEPVEGMSALAAALRRKDFEKAERHAKNIGEKLAASGAKLPRGAKEAAASTSKLGRELERSGRMKTGQGLQKLSEGASQNSPQKMAAGMRGLQEGLGEENGRNGERRRLQAQLSQLGFFKKSMGEGKLPGLGGSQMPRLSQFVVNQRQPGKGIGTESAPNRYGEKTELQGTRRTESLTGTMSEGESETTTTKTAQGQAEAARAVARANFQEYEKLSRQAIEDENIPAAHRQVIKRYFEKIRPELTAAPGGGSQPVP